jgi:subtilisin-like proprotein convertase family protein
VLKACGSPMDEVEPGESLEKFVQLGPIILQIPATATAGTYNTASIPTITTLVPFAPFSIPSGNFPADVEILASDPVNIYELMASGTVTRYTTAGVATVVTTVAPPAGETWTDMAVDPTTGTVYAASATGTCSASSLSSIDLLTGVRTPIGPMGATAGCVVGLAADNSGNLFGQNIVGDNLIAINKTTGAGTVVGLLGFDANFGQSADCDAGTGTCYLFAFNNGAFRGELRSVDTATGATTLVGVIGQTAPGGTIQASGAVFGTFGICQANPDCNDGNLCNGVETCDTGSGNCLPGTPITCNDGDQCTLDQCAPATGTCSFPPNPCSDGDPCTLDSCDPVAGCQHVSPGLVHLCNSGLITIPNSGPGTPYPSTIVAAGLSTNASLCSVELRSITHTFPADIDILLQGPVAAAQNATIMSDAGGSTPVTAIDLVLTDGAASTIPTPLVSGSFQPTNVGVGDAFPAPAPAPAGGSSLGIFAGNPNGTWRLFVVDDAGGDLGSISGGWCINIVQSVCDDNSDCDDGNACNGAETCNAGTCETGTPVTCDDGQFCTVDACVPADGSCVYTPNPCSDGDGCTVDSCDEGTDACSHLIKPPVPFCNTTPITMTTTAGPGNPYPSSIVASGVGTSASLCSVQLNGVTHTFPDDIDVLLVGPDGGAQNSIIMSDVGGSLDVNGINLTLRDSAASLLPDSTQLVSGTFRPTNIGTGDVFPAPAPTPAPGTASLGVFSGDLNGTWNLFVHDQFNLDGGQIGSWCVNIVVGSCATNSDCDDGNACNGSETCVDTVCQLGTPVDCSDGNPCTVDNCTPSDGSCFYTTTNCDDGNGCTEDFCDPATGCGHADHCVEFCNTGAITLNDGTAPPTVASPYPSSINVSLPPAPGVVSVANIKLNGLTHTFPDDLDTLLAGPTGASVVVLSDAGGGGDVTNVNLVLTDGAAAVVPDGGPIVSGTFRPSNFEATVDAFPAPAPAPPRGTALSAFNGLNPNGNWNLFFVDDANIDAGTLGGGWCINLLVSCSTDAECGDGDACTSDACVQGQCQNTGISCDDGNGCTDDSCDSASGCVNTDNSNPCEDGNACTTGDTCGGGSCQPGGPASCDDSNACTTDTCDAASGCVYTEITCDDGDACTVDTCDAASGCVYTEIPGCRCDAPEPNPHTRGYWKRLCHGPHSGDELTEDDAACVASLGSHFAGVDSVDDVCAVLNQSGNQCVQGEIELMSLALNLCHQLVCEDTPISSQYSDNTTVGDSYDDAEANLGSGGDCQLAKHLASEANTGRAVGLTSVSFAKLTGGGARVNWTPMGGGSTPVIKYNVWRRVAGSMAPFSKIGETTGLLFDDTTPGKFEYEITPVR